MLMDAGYGEDENIGALLNEQFCEKINHYIPSDENVAPQQPCKVVQSPNHYNSIMITLFFSFQST